MSIIEEISKINNFQDLAEFIQGLKQSYKENPGSWENGDLASYLDAMIAWIMDAEGYYHNTKQSIPNPDALRTVAIVLTAAKSYE